MVPRTPRALKSTSWAFGLRSEPADPERRLRRVARVVGVAAVLLWAAFLIGGFTVLAGQTADPRLQAPILALYREDGVVFADMVPCAGDRVRTVYVDDPAGYARWSVAAGPGTPPVSKLRLFEAPPGWRVTDDDPIAATATLDPRAPYLLWLQSDRGDQAAFVFTASQLESTARSAVLTATGRDDEDGDPGSGVVPRSEFERRAAEYCRRFPT
ncbi:hypothetical protein FAIPA1_540022 [Frankia sp. AiPs1]|uniref:hypothetical protein n=1 Tax=Frankia sp. AiPa1 TaxID=573492 RepID=UPI00202AE8FA|nr:hypothetical protein [Frankia sp. AiPa1]MCL9761022.1 hypothetical protein [Frankia sp. AiPa1]